MNSKIGDTVLYCLQLTRSPGALRKHPDDSAAPQLVKRGVQGGPIRPATVDRDLAGNGQQHTKYAAVHFGLHQAAYRTW